MFEEMGRVVKELLEKEVVQAGRRGLVHWAVSEESLGGGIDPVVDCGVEFL